MFVLALVIVVVLHLDPAVHAGGPPPLRARLEPRGGARRPACTTAASRSPPSSPAARSPGSPGSCTSAGSARSTSRPAPGLELAAIAAAVVGGVSTLGGSGTIIGAFLGAVLIGVLDQSLVRVEQISEFWRDAHPRRADPARGRARRRASADVSRRSGRADRGRRPIRDGRSQRWLTGRAPLHRGSCCSSRSSLGRSSSTSPSRAATSASTTSSTSSSCTSRR